MGPTQGPSPRLSEPEARVAVPRLLAGLIITVVLCIMLMVIARLGASWPVVVVAALGAGVAMWFAKYSRRLLITVSLVVGCVGLLGIEGVNQVQYGTLALWGPPAKVWWCGDTYRPSGLITHGLGMGDAPPFRQFLTTPAAYSVYVPGGGSGTCGATGPLLVQVGPRDYMVYHP